MNQESHRLQAWECQHAQDLLSDKENGNHFTLQFRNYPTVKLNVKPEDLPDELKDVKISVKPKLNEIKKAIKQDPQCRNIGCIAELEDNYKAQFKLK